MPTFIRAEDFTSTFESQGTSFIFEDIIGHHYVPQEGWMVACKVLRGEKIQSSVFVSKKSLEEMSAQGLVRTVEQTKAATQKLQALVNTVAQETAVYAQKQLFDKADAEHMLAQMARICQEYLYFDPFYWDGLFATGTSAETKEIIALVEAFKNKIREEINPIFFGKTGYLAVLLERMSEVCTVPARDVEWYTEKELLELFTGATVPTGEIESRKVAWFYCYDKGQVTTLSGASALEALALLAPAAPEQTEFRGKVAHGSGVVQGRAAVIRRDYGNVAQMYTQMESMGEGNILVSETTDPELMAAFKKARAVVTDLGGMLSHAAITARELNLPCIIGTQHASKMIKTGDLIEVDAGRGVVTILEKAHEKSI